jgi:hypothetical protein
MRKLTALALLLTLTTAGFSQQAASPVVQAIYDDVPVAKFKQIVGDAIDTPIAPSGWTPLCFAVAHGREKIAIWLMEQGANVNVEVGAGKSLVHLAAETQSGLLLRELHRRGLDVRAKDLNGYAPRDYALTGNREAPNPYPLYVEACLDLGLDFTPEERYRMLCVLATNYEGYGYRYPMNADQQYSAVSRVRLRSIERLLKQGTRKCQIEYRYFVNPMPTYDSPFVAAARIGDLEVMKLLTRYTPNWRQLVEAKSPTEWTLTDNACWCRNDHIVRYLRRLGLPAPRLGLKARLDLEREWRKWRRG